MNKEWRPDDWGYIAEEIRICFIEERSVIVNIDVFEAGASAMLAARDKWWIKIIDDYFESGLSRRAFDEWQSLKQSILEVKE